MSVSYWLGIPAFQQLCDLVAGDHLVCITGAGISSTLLQKADPARRVPQWPGLLSTLFDHFKDRLNSQDYEDCQRLLRLDSMSAGKEWPSGSDLILAASILRAVSPKEFDTVFRNAVTNVDGSFAELHSVIIDLQPNGIITFNYDSAK